MIASFVQKVLMTCSSHTGRETKFDNFSTTQMWYILNTLIYIDKDRQLQIILYTKPTLPLDFILNIALTLT